MKGSLENMILGVIPARGGSKGIPRKNIKLLLGKPLITWSIEAAQDSKLIDRLIVSTEDVEIAHIAKEAGVEVLNRPKELATDYSATIPVLRHALEYIDAKIVVLLQPTSPIRVNNLIDRAIERFLSSDCDTLATGYISKHYAWGDQCVPRQKIKGYFHDDGNIYVFKSSVIESDKWIGNSPHQMVVEEIYNLEIDNISDFWATEGILLRVLEGAYKL